VIGTKHDTGKPRWDLFPWDAGEEVVKVLNFGATKYEDRNWEKGIKYGRVFASTVRHLWSWFHSHLRGEDGTDPETGLSHLAHAGCCVLFLLAYELRGKKEWDDRPTRSPLESLRRNAVPVTAGEVPKVSGEFKVGDKVRHTDVWSSKYGDWLETTDKGPYRGEVLSVFPNGQLDIKLANHKRLVSWGADPMNWVLDTVPAVDVEAPLPRGVVKKSECLCAGVRPLKDGEEGSICSTCLGVRPAVTCKGGGCK
jgi:hypothetical protein